MQTPDSIHYFKRTLRKVSSSRIDWASKPKTPSPARLSPAQRAGLYYERKVCRHLESLFPYSVSQLTFRFREHPADREGAAIPDLLAYIPSAESFILFEVKSRHTHDGYRQLRNFYAPIVSSALGAPLRLVEVCKSYDPGVKLPGSADLIFDLVEWAHNPTGAFGIYPYSGKL